MFFPKKNVRVSVRNKQIVIETKTGINLYRFLLNEGIIQPTLCDGAGQCGKCKIKFLGSDIPKPTKKELLILAKISIEAGYRLACQHTVKKDIEVDTSELPSGSKFTKNNDDYPKALIDPAIDKKYIHDVNDVNSEEENNINDNEIDKESIDTEIDENNNQVDDTISISEFKPMATKERPKEDANIDGPSDGIFMIQQRGKVRYYCYSASLDNIVSEGTAETDEQLKDLIENGLIPDFIHNVLKIRDIDRVLMLIEDNNHQETKNLLNMVKYYKFEIGTLLCEVIMPYEENHNVIRFFRLLHAESNNKLIFSLDMLSRCHYLTKNLVTDITFNGLKNVNLLSITTKGQNNIKDLDNNFLITSIDKRGVSPDGITISALLKVVKLMYKYGIIDSNFIIKPRKELANIIPLDIAVRLTKKDNVEAFYIVNNRFAEIYITQNDLDALNEIRNYIHTMTAFTQEKIGKISGLVFYTASNHDNLINFMFDLGFIPRELADKTAYHPGDATINAIKLFKEKNMETFIENNLNNVSLINADDDEIFIKNATLSGLIK